MRIAIFAPDKEERYALSSLAEETLLKRGVLPEVALFPGLIELVEASAYRRDAFDLALVMGARDAPALRELCRRAPVILIGAKEDGPIAFDMGVGYFLENPADKNQLDKALTRCLGGENKEKAI